MRAVQQPLIPQDNTVRPYDVPFPSTRFQGSKRKLVDWIWYNVAELKFNTVLDAFGGTGAVSHMFKTAGKQVIYNDKLAFNWQIGKALIENKNVKFSPQDIETSLAVHSHVNYPDFIQRTFENIYFTHDENAWLDRVIYNIDNFLDDPFKQAIARFALYQSCIIKRPYNLFHRANLYMRQADVPRSFGNKSTWETPTDVHFRTFISEANAAIFDNGKNNRSLNFDAANLPDQTDLVYIDPPYIKSTGVGIDYRDFYHFLEGLTDYNNWPNLIDYRSKHKRLHPENSPWIHAKTIKQAFEDIIAKHKNSIIVISYRDDGIPSKAELIELLSRYKTNVRDATQAKKYALSTKDSHEILLIAT